jgi:hypothetical protein
MLTIWNHFLTFARTHIILSKSVRERAWPHGGMPVILGMLSVHAANIPESGLGTAGAVGKTGYAILDEVILSDYKETLQSIAKTGTREYMRAHMAPFMLQARTHFDLNQETMSQKWFSRAVSRLKDKLYQAG